MQRITICRNTWSSTVPLKSLWQPSVYGLCDQTPKNCDSKFIPFHLQQHWIQEWKASYTISLCGQFYSIVYPSIWFSFIKNEHDPGWEGRHFILSFLTFDKLTFNSGSALTCFEASSSAAGLPCFLATLENTSIIVITACLLLFHCGFLHIFNHM